MKLGNDVFLFYEVAKFILKFAFFIPAFVKKQKNNDLLYVYSYYSYYLVRNSRNIVICL